ncbi:MAG: hypothetical protein KDD61_13140 [Bdellovibrionales bacterium]|nr:hypothetical protein [Bdellovibrionales bacterium]
MKIKTFIIFILGGVLGAQVALGNATESARCVEQNDSLDQNQALSRTAWAFKCYPYLRGTMKDKKVMLHDVATGAKLIGYPMFGKINEQGEVTQYWSAPIDPSASCSAANTYSFIGFCRAGCYTPDQMVLFSDGYQSIGEAKKSLRQDIVTLSPESTLDSLEYIANTLSSYTVDPEPKQQDIVTIRTESGGELTVTWQHPLVMSTGMIKTAQDLVIGDQLIQESGAMDSIVELSRQGYFGKVINVEMESEQATDNIVVAQGFLNGSAYYQNIELNEINRKVLRSLIPDSLVK